jgi:two-component system chemotaxis response regulator CheY
MEKFAPVKRSEDGQPVRYLIVDDSVFARKNLARMVETFGGQVVGEAGDGVSAISEYERLTPDIVLMDITMPQMEGIEAAEKIVRDHPGARIVMVSSVGYQENIVAALQRGARHFVQKPVKPEVLYEVIKYVMRDDGTTVHALAPALGHSHADGPDSAFHQLGRRRAGAGTGVAHFHREPEHGRRGVPAERNRCRGDPHGRDRRADHF